MATANTYLQVSELDFQDIRSNLKQFLASQDQFKDYNFEGSAMSVMLDVLAYNTHYNSYYLNMVANEMFLDTAQQRESVVSHAKLLGYLPISAIGAQANVNIEFTGVQDGISQIIIPKNSTFTTIVDDVTYTYVTPESKTITSDTTTFTSDLTIKEGEPLTHRFTYNAADPQRMIIQNTDVDSSSITVQVQNSASDLTKTEFTQATNLVDIYGKSDVFFLQAAGDDKYEVTFGDGNLGKALVDGNIVIVDYLVCNGNETNGAGSFSIDSMNIGVTYDDATLSTNTSALGGRFAESIESIKFNAPKSYQTQNRCVIDKDYERILLTENAYLESVVAFGGENANPPVYGKVYVAVKPFGELYTTLSNKNKLKNSIIDRTPLGIDPVIIDAKYSYVIPEIITYFDKTKTKLSESEVRYQIINAINSYSEDNLGRFGKRFRYSRFVRALDNVLPNIILNNDATYKLQQRVSVNTNVAEKLELYYNNAIVPGSLDSSTFTYSSYNAYLEDDSEGNVNIYRLDANQQKVNIKTNAGTIDYDNGIVVIEEFKPSSYNGNYISFDVKLERLDVIPEREQIILLDSQDSNITVIAEYT